MVTLRETIDRLASSLADNIVAALRDAPLSELMLLTANGQKARSRQEATDLARPTNKATKKRATRTRAPKAPSPPARPDPVLLDAAAAFLTERGRKGATAPQLQEHLKARGFEQSAGMTDLVSILAERGVIRDAGFRRTTGNGTASVYLLASLE